MILFQVEAIFASSSSKFGKLSPAIDRDDFNSSNESIISTSVIHNIATLGKTGTRTHLDFESFLPTWKRWRCGGISQNQAPRFAVFADQRRNAWTWSFFWQEFMVDGLLAGIGIAVALPIRWSPLSTGCPVLTYLHWNRTCGTWTRRVKNFLWMILGRIKCRKLIATNVSLWFRQIPCVKWQAFLEV